MHVLLIEDEQKIADFVCAGLQGRGMSVEHQADGRLGFERACQGRFDAILLDLMLPGRDGLDVLRDLRARQINTPVILLTARNELGDRVEGLGLGADDYLAKPFYVEELAARLQALQRRASGERQIHLQVGGLKLDRVNRLVSVNGRMVDLTSREFALLDYLMRSAGQVFTRAQILEHVWGYDLDPSTNVVDVCIKRIRSKLLGGGSDADAQLIEAVRGVGYRLRSDLP